MTSSTINLYDSIKWMAVQKNPFRIEWIKSSTSGQSGGDVKIIQHALYAGQYRTKEGKPMIKFTDQDNEHKPYHTNIFSLIYLNGQKITV